MQATESTWSFGEIDHAISIEGTTWTCCNSVISSVYGTIDNYLVTVCKLFNRIFIKIDDCPVGMFLNSLANPMIYTVTNKRFRRFLMNWLQRDTSSVSDGGSHGNHFNGNGTSAVGNFTVKHVEGHQLSVARSCNSLQRNTPTLPRTGR